MAGLGSLGNWVSDARSHSASGKSAARLGFGELDARAHTELSVDLRQVPLTVLGLMNSASAVSR
jgi:hypothetical protein